MNIRKYKGYEIHKQYVGPCGWNVVDPQGNVAGTGLPSLDYAKGFIAAQMDDGKPLTAIEKRYHGLAA